MTVHEYIEEINSLFEEYELIGDNESANLVVCTMSSVANQLGWYIGWKEL